MRGSSRYGGRERFGIFFGDPADLQGLYQCVASMLAGVHGKHKCCLKEIRMNIYLDLYHLTHTMQTNERKRKLKPSMIRNKRMVLRGLFGSG